MKKPKKITIKFFLNTNLQAIAINKNEEGYPLYMQITYDRRNTQIKCRYGAFYTHIDSVKKEQNALLNFEEYLLRRVTEYELKRLETTFQLKGLGDIYDGYSLSIYRLFNSYLKMRVKAVLKEAKPKEFLEIFNLDKSNTAFETIMQAAERLFDNFKTLLEDEIKQEIEIFELYKEICKEILVKDDYKFPIIMDWIDGTHQLFLTKKLKQKFNNTNDYQAQEQKLLGLLQKIITTKLELK
ncbi:MAG: hypothetical protein EAZ85_14295 [Bacteroidetes bacterium]|nr:MAG: hypothetical protein EAZ85_14295 [Bacteroidota bacterium]TAG90550.1 MAG: hypothetical protein EAZ20_03985 [Bacteroidota bacterium]